MQRLSAILLLIVFMSSVLFAQDTNSKFEVKKLTPELKEKISKMLKDKPALQQQENQENNLIAVPLESIALPVDNPQSLKNILHSKKPMEIPPDVRAKGNELFKQKNEKKSPQFQGEMTQLPNNIRYIGEFEESQAVLVSVPSSPYYLVDDGNGGTIPIPVFTTNLMSFVNNNFQFFSQMFGQEGAIELMYLYYSECEPGDAIVWPWVYYPDDFQPNQIAIIDITNVTWISDFRASGAVDTAAPYVWSNLINAIQQEAQVWIRMTAINDTTALKNYMSQRGMPLTNYKFVCEPTGEDAFWARDWGPHGFYYDDNGTRKLGFHDAQYYTGRPFDDIFPRKLLGEAGYDYYDLQIKMEGGNMMTDGYGDATYGDVIYGHNDSYVYQGTTYPPDGQYYYDYENSTWNMSNFKAMNKTEVDAKMKQVFNMNNPNLVQSLKYDGGTGHIDLWIKQFDEETMLIANMPDKYSGLTDYKIIQKNREYLNNKTTTFGTKYRFLNAPMPKRYDGPYPTQSGDMPTKTDSIIINSGSNNYIIRGDDFYDLDPRGYLNGVLVNKSYIYPSFSRSASDPCWQSDQEAKEILQKLLPGYKLIPIDSRSLTPKGGAIHCITMQIPQDPAKVITIKHKPYRDHIELAQSFEVSAEWISNTDANKFVLYWKKINDAEWHEVELVYNYDFMNEPHTGYITGDFVKEDTIRYYIAAQKDNEIKKCSPIVAPEGYYEFYFNETSIDELYGYEPQASIIASVYPNPATNYLNVIFENIADGDVRIDIVNSIGQTMSTPVNKFFNKGVFIFDITELNLNSGVYFLKMTTALGVSTESFTVNNK